MSQLYAFSPISSKKQFEAAIQHIARQASLLSEQLTGKKLPVDTVKIFAHYPQEFAYLQTILPDYGTPASIGRSTSLYVQSTMVIDGNALTHIGIRVPDPYRLQTGCVDYKVNDTRAIAKLVAKDKHGYLRQFPDMPNDFIELWHPDFDVAGYIPLT